MAATGQALIRDLPPVVDLRPVPPPVPAPPPALETRIIELGPLPDGRPRAPRREVKLAVPGYPGFTVWLWSNFPTRVALDVDSKDEPRMMAALRRLVVAHNGWCDEDGEPYPSADDPGFWEAIPQELGTILFWLIASEARTAFPKSMMPPAGS